MTLLEIDEYVLMKQALQSAYKEFTRHNATSILGSPKCVCLACKERFTPFDVVAWEDKSAVCPKCGRVAVAGHVGWTNLTNSLIDAMHEYWLEAQCLPEDFDWSLFAPMR
jgi:hypothetical protein